MSNSELRLSDLDESQGPLHLSELDSVSNNESQGPLRLSDLNNTGGKTRKQKRNKKHRKKTKKNYKKRKSYKKRKIMKKRKTRRMKGGDVDTLGSADFNPNLAYDSKKVGGQNIGASCPDPNFSIFNTKELQLFPYKPTN